MAKCKDATKEVLNALRQDNFDIVLIQEPYTSSTTGLVRSFADMDVYQDFKTQNKKIETRIRAIHLLHSATRIAIYHSTAKTEERVTKATASSTMIIYTDGSKTAPGVGVAYVAYLDGVVVEEKKFTLAPYCSVYEAEFLALHHATTTAISSGRNFAICSESKSSLDTLTDRNTTHNLAYLTQRAYVYSGKSRGTFIHVSAT